jgi:tRNA nucleotidyltransferase (CCA-adding enzyme)
MNTIIQVPATVSSIIQAIHNKNGLAIIVGGYIRDQFLGITSKDIDIEVFNISTLETLKTILDPFGKVSKVGKCFGVLQLIIKNNAAIKTIDFSLPRTETNIGAGHKDFTIKTNPALTYKKAAGRRDFTINSIGYNPLEQKILDPFNGLRDLKTKTLRHINSKFAEDPLRVYRAMQFIARFNLKASPPTLKLCSKMDLSTLPKERIHDEFNKLLLKSKKPSLGLNFLLKSNVITYHPELFSLINCPQNPNRHPEGSVWNHTLLVVDEMAKHLTNNHNKDQVLMYAALTHDFGKPLFTKQINKNWVSFNHEEFGIVPAKSFLDRLTNNKTLIRSILALIRNHSHPFHLYYRTPNQEKQKSLLRRLSLEVSIQDLSKLALADYCGRKLPKTTLKEGREIYSWLTEKAAELNILDQPTKPFLQGRDLITLGMQPSPQFKKILDQAFNQQLDGILKTKTQALKWLKKNLCNKN